MIVTTLLAGRITIKFTRVLGTIPFMVAEEMTASSVITTMTTSTVMEALINFGGVTVTITSTVATVYLIAPILLMYSWVRREMTP
jgi:hypothetical protein